MFIYLFQSYVCHAFATGIEEIEQIGGQSAIGAEFEGIIVACGLAIYDVVRLEDAFPPYVIKGSPIVVVDAQFLATDTAVIDGCARSVVVAPALILRAKGGAPPTAYPLSRSGGEASIGPRDDVNGVLVLETETDLHTRLATNVPLAQYVRWFALLGNFTYTAAVSLSLKLVACKGVESATASHVVLARAVVRHVLCNLYPLAVLLLKSLLKLSSAQQLCVSGFDRLVDAGIYPLELAFQHFARCVVGSGGVQDNEFVLGQASQSYPFTVHLQCVSGFVGTPGALKHVRLAVFAPHIVVVDATGTEH